MEMIIAESSYLDYFDPIDNHWIYFNGAGGVKMKITDRI